MIKILFVCYGNICRSPMAEFVMKDLIRQAGMTDEFAIASAATSREEIGNPVHHGTRNRLAREGISVEGKRARQMTKADYAHYDLLIGMESANIRSMMRIAGGDADHKMHRLLDFTDHPWDIADPWYTGDFDSTYADVLAGCRGLLERCMEEHDFSKR